MFFQCLAWIATGVSAIIAVVQLYKGNKRNKFEYITKLRNEFQNNKDLVDLFYEIDYEHFCFDKENFHESEKEKNSDSLLAFFTNIAYLKKFNIMDEDQLKFFQYEIHSIYTNSEIEKYRFYLIDLYKKEHVPFKFEEFFKLAEAMENQLPNVG